MRRLRFAHYSMAFWSAWRSGAIHMSLGDFFSYDILFSFNFTFSPFFDWCTSINDCWSDPGIGSLDYGR